MIRLSNIKIREDLSENELFDKIFRKYKINKQDVRARRIVKKSIDARNKNDVFYNYSVEIECKNEERIKNAQKVIEQDNMKFEIKRKSKIRPVVIGAGPAGLFAALTLAKNGFKKVLLVISPKLLTSGFFFKKQKKSKKNLSFRKYAI